MSKKEWLGFAGGLLVMLAIGYVLSLVYCKRGKSFHELFYPHLYQALLPDDRFDPPAHNSTDYWTEVTAGYEHMKNKTVFICGLIRDAAENIPRIVKRVETLGNLFKTYYVLIIENDSVDQTPELLHQWSESNNHVRVHTLKGLAKKHSLDICKEKRNRNCKKRLALLSTLRQKCVEEAQNERYKDSDYVIMMDMDLRGGLSLDGVAHSFGILPEYKWDGVFALGMNGNGTDHQMYDTGAVVRRNGSNVGGFRDPWVYHLSNCSKRGDPLVKVLSAFNGMAIYKHNVFTSGTYTTNEGIEHRGFHTSLRNAGFHGLYINPSLLLYNGELYACRHKKYVALVFMGSSMIIWCIFYFILYIARH